MKNATAKTALPPRAFGSGFALRSLPGFAWVPPWAPLRALAGLLAFLLLAALFSGSGGRVYADDKSDELRRKYEQLEQQLADEKKELESIQAQRQNVQADKAEMEAKINELAANIQAANSAISAAQALEQARQVEIDATQAAAAQARKEFDDYLRSVTASSFTPAFLSGSFVWPTSSNWVTQYYSSGGHGGLDIGAPAGTPICAAAEGTVTISGWHDHPYSYGNYVVIDHGGGMSTFYAHMSSRACSAGDYVQQGQVIGYVGSTGYSEGNHLHFEVRINGSRIDPMAYFNS